MIAKSPTTTRLQYMLMLVGLIAVTFLASYWISSRVSINRPLALDPAKASTSGAATVNPPYALHDFTLTNQNGESVSLSSLRGQAVLLFFGYTHCPDVCPGTLADYTRVKKILGGDAEKVAFVFISIDGERDTPEVIANYLTHFDNNFLGLTGSETELRKIGVDYGLTFSGEKVTVGNSGSTSSDPNDQNYFLQHTSPSFLVDPQGKLRMVYFFGAKPNTIASGIQQILQERN